jgi:quercetin dioxygenase-like cupin family protein
MTRTVRVVFVFAAFAMLTASAQQPDPAKPPPRSTGPAYPTPAPNPSGTAPRPTPGVLGPAPNFTGNTTTLGTEGYNLGRRVFAAGARNATWHAHSAGQLVFGEKGRGRLQIQGQPIKELGVGDSAFIPGGSFHWHGASPNEEFTMVYITMGASKTSQGEPVTDDVYLGRKK